MIGCNPTINILNIKHSFKKMSEYSVMKKFLHFEIFENDYNMIVDMYVYLKQIKYMFF